MNARTVTLTLLAALVAMASPAALTADDDGVTIVVHDEEGASSTESGSASDSAFWIEDETTDEEEKSKPSGPWGAIGGGGFFGDQTGWFGSAYVGWPAFYVYGDGGEWQDVELGGTDDENEYGFYNALLGWNLPWIEDVSLEVSAYGSELTTSAEFPMLEAFGWSWGLAWQHAFDNGAHVYVNVHGYDLEGSFLGVDVEDEGITATAHGSLPFNDRWFGWGTVSTGMQVSIPGTDALGVPSTWKVGTTWLISDNIGIGAAYGQTDWDVASGLMPDSQTADWMGYLEIFFGG